MNLDATLARLAADPFTPVDLAELNLHLAHDADPDLRVEDYLEELDGLADEIRFRIRAERDLEAQVAILSEFLFDECGFEGNADHYYDARNSYLHQVLDRKLGIPISLSVLAIAVGSRCGLLLNGIGLPGHFIAQATRDCETILFDPFHGGQLLDNESCENLVGAVTGHPFVATEDSLAPSPPGHIAIRMLNNLKGIHLRNAEFPEAAKIIKRLVQLSPDDPVQKRDLGVAQLHAEQPGAALTNLEHYLRQVPDAEDTEAVKGILKVARKLVSRWN